MRPVRASSNEPRARVGVVKVRAGIEGLSAAESEPLLASLLALATRPEHIYTHRWQAGDLLVWGNASMMDKPLPPAEGAAKTTYRITISGKSGAYQ